MDRLPVEWIDDLVFPERLDVAVTLPLETGQSNATASSVVQSDKMLEPSLDAVSGRSVQRDATSCVVGGAGLEPAASSV